MPIIKCDPRAKARCPFKNLCCGDEDDYFVDGSGCDKFNQSVLAPPSTNADRIRAMSDEALAEFFEKVHEYPCEACCNNLSSCRRNNALEPVCKRHYLDWLQQPAEEG